ncbi:MAG: hypothetical protein AAF449_17480 [Myxococcota bacterium]
MPPTWRAFRADPDDAAPSIARALATQQLDVQSWDQVQDQMVSSFLHLNEGLDSTRERYIVRWERSNDGTLAIFVRHEMQTRIMKNGVPAWNNTEHDPEKEADLLDAITKQLERLHQPPPSARR